MRVLRDVEVEGTERGDLLALSHVPGLIDECMSVHLLGAGTSVQFMARVVESRPAIVDGSVRYRLRLKPLRGATNDGVRQPHGPAGLSGGHDVRAARHGEA